MHRPMTRHPVHRAKLAGPQTHRKMALATSIIARMSGVAPGFIHDLNLLHVERRFNCRANLCLFRHFFASGPFLFLRNKVNSRVRVEKVFDHEQIRSLRF